MEGERTGRGKKVGMGEWEDSSMEKRMIRGTKGGGIRGK